MWMRSRGGKGPPSAQPHKGPVCWAHDEQGTYPAVHPPHRESFPQDFSSSFFFWVKVSARRQDSKKKKKCKNGWGDGKEAGGGRGPE